MNCSIISVIIIIIVVIIIIMSLYTHLYVNMYTYVDRLRHILPGYVFGLHKVITYGCMDATFYYKMCTCASSNSILYP